MDAKVVDELLQFIAIAANKAREALQEMDGMTCNDRLDDIAEYSAIIRRQLRSLNQ